MCLRHSVQVTTTWNWSGHIYIYSDNQIQPCASSSQKFSTLKYFFLVIMYRTALVCSWLTVSSALTTLGHVKPSGAKNGDTTLTRMRPPKVNTVIYWTLHGTLDRETWDLVWRWHKSTAEKSYKKTAREWLCEGGKVHPSESPLFCRDCLQNCQCNQYELHDGLGIARRCLCHLRLWVVDWPATQILTVVT